MRKSIARRGTIWYRGAMGTKQVRADALSLACASILNKKRREVGWSYNTIEEKAGLPRMRGQRALKGERSFLVDDVEAIASALGLKASAVVREAEDSLALQIVSEPASKLEQDDYAPAAHNPGVDIEAEQEGMMEES